jgi:tetratricopeptide (TPR) repeat protein
MRIAEIVQKIVYLGLPLNSRHLRFVQFLANSAYLACLIGGFVRLWQNGADLTTILLLIVGSGLLSLTCLHYAWFWKPELQDRNAPDPEPSDSDGLVERQQINHRLRQRTRRLAIIGIFTIPLLTCGGFLTWRSLPPAHILLLVANFDGTNQQNYQVTETVLRNLRKAAEPYADIRVQALNQTITEQQGSDVARAKGEQKKAAIVIWGEYGVTPTDVQMSVHYELLNLPEIFLQTSAIVELNRFKLQTRLSNEMSYIPLFTLGMVRYAEKNWESSIARFSNALDALDRVKEPAPLGQEAVYFYRGNSYYYKSDYQNAIADYNQALKLKPSYVDAYYNRGTAYFDQGNNTQAIADYSQAIKLKLDDVRAYSSRGDAHFRQGNDTQAIADLNQSFQLKLSLAIVYNNRGYVYFDQGKYTQAITDFNQALELKPDDAEAYYNRGTAYFNQGNDTQAITDFNQALKLKPSLTEAYTNRGMTYARQDNNTQAIADFNQAIKLKSDDAGSYYNRGIAHARQGNDTQAITDFTQAIKLNSNLAEAYNNRGYAYFDQGKYTQAIADHNQAIKLKPDDAEAYIDRGISYSRQGNDTQAIADFSQAIKLKPDYADAYYNKACVYSLKKEVKAAIENLQRAIALDATLRKNAKTDPDFDNIRQDQQFQALVGK